MFFIYQWPVGGVRFPPWWEMEILNKPRRKSIITHLRLGLTLQKYFSHPSLIIYFFATPPIKPKMGTAPTHRTEIEGAAYIVGNY
jgi:hypothetical protein